MTAAITFAAPAHLLLIPAVLLIMMLAGILLHFRKSRLERFFPVVSRQRMQLGGSDRCLTRLGLATLGLLFVVLALARPQWGYTWREVERRGLEIVVLLDTSNSMRANDLTPSRLQRAKWGIEEFVRELDGDRIALVGFAGEAQVLCPLTLDYRAFMMHLDDVFPGIIPRGGTNIEAGLRKSLETFEDETGEADRVILLITDGEAHEGDLNPVLRELRDEGVRVFAIGIGDPEGALIPLPDNEGGPYLRNRQGEVVMSRLDEAALLRITRQTNGLYFRASQSEFGTRQLIEQGLAPLKRAQLENTRIREMEDRYQIFLGLGLLILFLEGFFRVPQCWTPKAKEAS